LSSAATTPLRYTKFRNLWLASVVTNLGSFLQAVAGAWLMLELTGSALWVGLIVAAPMLPMLFVAMPAGAMADLLDRRKILLGAQALMAVSAAVLALLTLTDRITPATLLALGLAMGVGQCLNLPAWQAMVGDLVPNQHVASAVALNSAAFNVARSVGPAIGGLLVATVGAGPAFAANALSYLAVMGAVATLPKRALEEPTDSILGAIASGVRYARFTPAYRWLLLVAATFALTSGVVQSVLPTFTEDALGGSAATYGVLLGAMGVGALVGAFTRPAAASRLGKRMVAASIGAFGLAGVGLGLSSSPLLAGLAMALLGLLWVWILSTLNATTQLLSPSWVRGRIMSLYTLAFMGFLPLGSVAAGAVADVIGSGAAIVMMSVGSIVLGVVVNRLPLPALGDVETPTPPEDFQQHAHPAQVDGGPIMVLTTWVIDEADLASFLQAMDQLRRVRLRTGAYRWRLYRNVGDPHRMTEAFLCTSWSQHLAQHRRLDRWAAETITRARAFDRAEGPTTHHLAAVDCTDPGDLPVWDDLLAHEDMHRQDGSVPLAAPRSARRPAPALTAMRRRRQRAAPSRPRLPGDGSGVVEARQRWGRGRR
jgi:MFS family permease